MEILTILFFGLNKDNTPLFKIAGYNIIGTIKDMENYQGEFNYGSIEIMINDKSLELINDKRHAFILKKKKYVPIKEYLNILNIYI
tara:strand:- start:80 stop:337 length:258 start_codon:yes stop_codon:yes gene_type:complete